MNLFPTIMAGGPGARLWPLSRRERPKPFLSLLKDGRSLIRATLDRVGELAPNDSRFVVAGRSFAALVKEQAPELLRERVLLEPIGRDTAPCVAWAALEASRIDEDAIMLVLPSDHLISPDEEFRAAIRKAAALVESEPEALVTLGVEPEFPSTAYGYIERGNALSDGSGAYQVARFREKPDAATAEAFIASKRFYWNAGIFVWKARTYLELLQKYEPEFVPTLVKMRSRIEVSRASGLNPDDDPEFIEAFSQAKRVSVDYAVLERAEKVFVVPASGFSWNDIGSYHALEETARETTAARANAVVGAYSLEENSSDNFVCVQTSSDRKKLVVLVDVDDLLVVETDSALLIADKKNDQAIKTIVKRLEKEGFDKFL